MKNKEMITFVMIVMIAILVLTAQIPTVHAATTATDATHSSLSISLVNYDPDPAIAGATTEVRLGIQNAGTQNAEDMVVEFVPSYPFTLAAGDNAAQSIGSIQGLQGYYDNNSMIIIKYNILVNQNAQAGTYNIKFKSYKTGSSSSIETSLPIEVQNRANAEVIQIDKTNLTPGKQTSLKFRITNVGSAPLRDITFSWSNSAGVILPVGSDNTKYIKYIDVGASTDLEYQVMANSNANAGLYSLSLKLIYTDPISGNEKSINTTAGMYVGGETDFDIAFSETSSSQTSFTIANIGSNPASSVSVIIPKQSGWSTTGANSMIIGNLNTGDYTVASFTLQSTQTSIQTESQGMPPGANMQRNISNISQNRTFSQRSNAQASDMLLVDIAYTDTMGNREVVEKNVSMGQSTASSASGNSTSSSTLTSGMYGLRGARQQQSFFSKYKTYIIVFVVLAVLIFGGVTYRRYRKEKLINPNIKLKDLFKKKETPASKKK